MGGGIKLLPQEQITDTEALIKHILSNIETTTYIPPHTPRTSTLVIACYDSTLKSKRDADYKFDGIEHQVIIEDCEDAWNESVAGGVTSTADTTDKKVGTASAKFVVDAAVAAGTILATEAISSLNLSWHRQIKLWAKCSVDTAKGDLQLLLDNTASCATPTESLNFPALTANTWTQFSVRLAAPASDTAIISVGLKYVTDLGACTIWLDNVKQVWGDEEKLTAALAVLPASGGSIDVREGTGNFCGAATATRGNFELRLDGGTTFNLLIGAGNNEQYAQVACLLHVAPTNLSYNVRISGGTWNCNKATQINYQSAIYLSNIRDCILSKSKFKNVTGETLWSDQSSEYVKAEKCDFDTVGYAGLQVDLDKCNVNNVSIGSMYSSMTDCLLTDVYHGGAYPTQGKKIKHSTIIAKAASYMTAVNVEYGNLKDIGIEGNEIDVSAATEGHGIGVTPNSAGYIVRDIRILWNHLKGTTGSSFWAIKVGGFDNDATINDVIIDDNYIDTWETGIWTTFFAGRAHPSGIFIGAGNKYRGNTIDIYPKGDNITLEVDPNRECHLKVVATAGNTDDSMFGRALTGTGAVYGPGEAYMATGVGVAPSSSASVYFRPKIGTHDYTADFSKPYIVEWLVYRSVDNANAVSYLKVDDDTGPNDPDSKAFGFKIANFALYGLAYDTSLDTVDLSTTLTGSTTYRLKAWHVPGVGIFFFANGVYLGMSTHEPSGTLANAEQVIANITNGGTAVDTLLVLKAVDIRRTW